MATAQHFIERALSRAGIRAAETPVEASELQDGLSLLNDMLASWEVVTPIGFEPVENASDQVRAPRFANAAIIDNLAVTLAPEYSRGVPIALATSAQARRDEMMVALVDIGEVNYPSTLPIGSGNRCQETDLDRPFFPSDDSVNF